MKRVKNSPFPHQTGFGLAEILVGLAIGLVVTLVVTQAATTFEGQKRATSGNADAQTNGSIALYLIQREAQMAGFGLPVFSAANQPLNCDPSPEFDHDADPATSPIGMFPATIIDGGDAAGASDALVIRSGSASLGGTPMMVTSVGAGGLITVTNNLGCQANDVVISTKGSACAMTKVASVPDPATDTTQITLLSSAGVVTGASLGCMGGWQEKRYLVRGDNLVEQISGVAAPRVANIVNIQAQYGVSAAPSDNHVTAWVNATGATWGPGISIANRNRIKAIRIAIVARNGLLEKTNVTDACSSLTESDPPATGLCAWQGSEDNPAPAIDLSKNADGADNAAWQRYRYRVFESVIPLRNMIWSKDTL